MMSKVGRTRIAKFNQASHDIRMRENDAGSDQRTK